MTMRNVQGILEMQDFECHVFKLGSYNDVVAKSFKLPYPDETACLLALSRPSLFQSQFLPWLKECFNGETCVRDPLDTFMQARIGQAVKDSHPASHNSMAEGGSAESPVVIHDFDISPMRRPLVVMQTAAHVAGAAFYYSRKLLRSDPWPETKKIFGVCLHPKYGGWFAIRAVIVFPGLQLPTSLDIPRPPAQMLKTDEEIVNLLELFNKHWRDWRFRDCIPSDEKYDHMQRAYFDTPPGKRLDLVKSWMNEGKV